MVLSPCGKITSFLCYGHMNRNWNYFQTPNYYDTKHWTSGQVLVSNISWSLRLSVVWFVVKLYSFCCMIALFLIFGSSLFLSFVFILVGQRKGIDWSRLSSPLFNYLFFGAYVNSIMFSLIKMWVDCAQLPSSDFVVILYLCSGSQWSASMQL